MFWGAPLIAREFETGTLRLAWTQSVTRRRWLAVKLGVVAAASAVAVGLLSLMASWWFSPIDSVTRNRFGLAPFGLRGVVPAGYALFAFALGATVGLLIRRTVPAMAVTLVGFVAARLAATYWVRPHLMAPAHLDMAIGPNSGLGFTGPPSWVAVPTPDIPNAWLYSASVVNQAGEPVSGAFLKAHCPNLAAGMAAPPGAVSGGGAVRIAVPFGARNVYQHCVKAVAAAYHEVVVYQPANRYWTFQWLETLVFVAAALVLAGICVGWIRHRVR
jgi:hypothetical protein